MSIAKVFESLRNHPLVGPLFNAIFDPLPPPSDEDLASIWGALERRTLRMHLEFPSLFRRTFIAHPAVGCAKSLGAALLVRGASLNWVHRACTRLGLSTDCFFLTRSLFDRTIAKLGEGVCSCLHTGISIQATCLLLAMKVLHDADDRPLLGEVVNEVRRSLPGFSSRTVEDFILSTERSILGHLSFNLQTTFPDERAFLYFFQVAVAEMICSQIPPACRQQEVVAMFISLSRYLCELAVLDAEITVPHCTWKQASLACIVATYRLMRLPVVDWRRFTNIVALTGISHAHKLPAALARLVTRVLDVHSLASMATDASRGHSRLPSCGCPACYAACESHADIFASVREKYAAPRYGNISHRRFSA